MASSSLSFRDMCRLFCCPPCPGQIASKLFFLPPDPTYSVIHDDTLNKYKIHFTEKAEWQYSENEMKYLDVFMTRTMAGNTIPCVMIKPPVTPPPKYTILFSQGNAVDMGQMSSFYLGLGTRLGVNVFAYDYSGYGASVGTSSEKKLYLDIEAAFRALRDRYEVSPENIILYGQCFGGAPTIHLATKFHFAGVILQSPFSSAVRVAFPDTQRTWFFDSFTNIEKIGSVTSIVLVIHGTEDENVDFSHGLAIYKGCRKAVEPLWLEGAGNDVEVYPQYMERLKKFIQVELAN